MLLVGCGGDDNGIGPASDARPSVGIIESPHSVYAGETMTLVFLSADDVELGWCAVHWGDGTPPDVIQCAGRQGIRSRRSHIYGEVGTYRITVRASDSRGQTAEASRTIKVEPPPPGAPLDVAARALGTSVIVTWTPGAYATFQEVRLQPQGQTIITREFKDNTTAATRFVRLLPGTYSVQVFAINSAGRRGSAVVVVTVSTLTGKRVLVIP